jgi:hypothetical protein
LRQAYDYWQNQPGNYLERGGPEARAIPPRGEAGLFHDQGTPEGAIPNEGGSRSQAHRDRQRHPIAPTEFPKARSATRRMWASPIRGVTSATQAEGPLQEPARGGLRQGVPPQVSSGNIGIAHSPSDSNMTRQPGLTGRWPTYSHSPNNAFTRQGRFRWIVPQSPPSTGVRLYREDRRIDWGHC